MRLGEIYASGESIESILTRSKYTVPFFQRGFAWEKEQVTQFWEDIYGIMDPGFSLESVRPYFIGAMVFESDDERTVIIDGQQRLATITILLSVIRDLLWFDGHEAEATQIHTTFISKRDLHLREEYIVTLGERNRLFFEDYIQMFPPGKFEDKQKAWRKRSRRLRKGSNKLILDTNRIFHQLLVDELKNVTLIPDKDYLLMLANMITKKLRAVTINVGTEADAFGVFETLNDRGIELSISDLFKNHVFSKAQIAGVSTLERVRTLWTSIVNLLGERDIPRFLRHYWISRYEHVRRRELYNAIKTYTKTQGKGVDTLIQELEKEAEVYQALTDPSQGEWSNEITLNALSGLKSLGVKQCYPLLLAAKQSLNKKNFQGFPKFVENLTFRYSTVCKKNPNKLEREYSMAAIRLRKEGDSAFQHVLIALSKLSPPDAEFERSFVGDDFTPNNTVARHILSRIEMSFAKDSPWVVAGSRTVNTEHILPKSLDHFWKNVVEKNEIDHKRTVQRLGNLTLLEGKKNTKLSNSPFPIKRKVYLKSKLKITEQVATYNEWNEDTIREHQEWLYNKAKHIW